MNSSMRLKVNGDTFFLPNPNGDVYFRNNVGSFQMKGDTIDQWIEQLIPVLNGEHTMEELTDELPDEYRNRVYEIAEVLHANGFVRDVSQDRQHQLTSEVLHKYASQIEFLDSFGGSGAYRFQSYREVKVLAIGSGPFLLSLCAALMESGMPRFHLMITDTDTTDRQRLSALVAHARLSDPEVGVEEIGLPNDGSSNGWCETVRLYDAVLYVSQEGYVEPLQAIHAACREAGKVLLPAMFIHQAGVAGPLVRPDSEACLESAWRRVHSSALCKDPGVHVVSSTAEAMLANVIVFEWFKSVTGVTKSELNQKVFLLNLETLEGSWHSFLPHPLVHGRLAVEREPMIELPPERNPSNEGPNELIPYFSTLTSAETGILHIWEEGDLFQLPLMLCRVQAADPLSEGPAELLPEIVSPGLTHTEARREAGLAGIEAYVSRMTEAHVGVGAGATIAEGICRGLSKYMTGQLARQLNSSEPSVVQVRLTDVCDDRCRHDWSALTTMQGTPEIAVGEDVMGFPLMWVGSNGRWYGSVGLNRTQALRMALQQALLKSQCPDESVTIHAVELVNVRVEQVEPRDIVIDAFEEGEHAKVLEAAKIILKANRKRLSVIDLADEPFLKEGLAGVFGVSLREEESQ